MKAPLRWGFYIFISINKKFKQMNEMKRMQRLAGLITESQLNERVSPELDSFLRDLANEPLLGGYLLDYNFDSPAQLILHISKEPAKSGQKTAEVQKLGTITYYPTDNKWSLEGLKAKGNDQQVLDKIASLAGG